jgi:hypothetical protein
MAMAGTEEAVNAAVSLRLPPAGFVQRLGFLEDLEFFHRSSSLVLIILPHWPSFVI